VERVLKNTLPSGRFERVSPTRSATMRAVKGKGNKTTELAVRMALVRAGVRGWRMHARDIEGVPDLYFPRKRVAVFLDGCFWHGCPRCGHVPKENNPYWAAKLARNRARDKKKNQMLRRAGVRVLRIWEHDIKKDISKCVARVQAFLRQPKKA